MYVWPRKASVQNKVGAEKWLHSDILRLQLVLGQMCTSHHFKLLIEHSEALIEQSQI